MGGCFQPENKHSELTGLTSRLSSRRREHRLFVAESFRMSQQKFVWQQPLRLTPVRAPLPGSGESNESWFSKFSGIVLAISLSVAVTGCGSSATSDSGAAENASDTEMTTATEANQAAPQSLLTAVPNRADRSAANSADETQITATLEWLAEQVRQAHTLHAASDYSNEAKLWDRVVDQLEKDTGPGYWVTAGARMSQEVAHRLSQTSSQQRQQWKRFQQLESERQTLADQMASPSSGRSSSSPSEKLNRSQFQTSIDRQLQIIQQQEVLVIDIFGSASHLLGNLNFARAQLFFAQGDFAQALVCAEKSLYLRQLSIKVHHPDGLASLKLMGQIAQAAGKHETALDCFTKAAQQARRVWGEQHLNVAVHANDLGVYCYTFETQKVNAGSKDFSDAGFWLDQALRIRRQGLGTGHVLTAMSQRNWALLKMAEGVSKPLDFQLLDLVAADQAMSEAIKGLRANKVEAATLNQSLVEASTIKMLLKEFTSAESLLKEVLNSEVTEFDPESLPLSLASLHFRIGIACARQATPDKRLEAATFWQQSIALAKDSKLPNDLKTIRSAEDALAKLSQPASSVSDPTPLVIESSSDRQTVAISNPPTGSESTPSGKNDTALPPSDLADPSQPSVRISALPAID